MSTTKPASTWTVYRPATYGGTHVDKFLSAHETEAEVNAVAAKVPGAFVRAWTRFHVRPWMQRQVQPPAVAA